LELKSMKIRFTFRQQLGLRLGAALFAATAMCIGSVRAADKEPSRIVPAGANTSVSAESAKLVTPGEVSATPEMWFYEQTLQRYNDPKVAVRANAEFKADQRRARMAAMSWYGYSNSRPASGIDVTHGPAQAQWAGNGSNSQYWVAPRASSVLLMAPGAPQGY
jgi:hypothetical protein